MDASIKGNNIRTFVRLLQCASKFGDDLHISVGANVWEMSVTSSSQSAYCLFRLEKGFFSTWKRRGRKSEDVTCRILVKSILAVLSKSSQIATVQKLDLRIIDPSSDLRPRNQRRRRRQGTAESDETEEGDRKRFVGDEERYSDDEEARGGIEAKLVIRLMCNHGVTRKHSLHLASSDFSRVEVNPETTPSGFVISSRTLRDWLDHFSISFPSGGGGGNASGGLSHLGWMFTKDSVRVKSIEGGGTAMTGLSTEIKVDVDEFEEYEVMEDRVDLQVPMKEFKGTLTLAEQMSITLNVCFSKPGQPLTLTTMENELEDISLCAVISTVTSEVFKDVLIPGQIPAQDRDARSRSQTATAEPGEPNASARRSKVTSQRLSKLEFSVKPSPRDAMVTVYLPQNDNNASQGFQRAPSSSAPRHMQDPTGSQRAASAPPSARPGNQEPLFFPGSQDDLDNDAPPSQGQRQPVRMTQQEVLELAGLGDMDLDELGDELDLEEEEMRASQMAESQTLSRDHVSAAAAGAAEGVSAAVGYGNLEEDETMDDSDLGVRPEWMDSTIELPAQGPGGVSVQDEFTWDTTIDLGQAGESVMAQLDGRVAGGAGKGKDKEEIPGEKESAQEVTADLDMEWIDDEDEDEDDELGMTQLPKSKFKPLFDD
ncbi:hypothetical protein IAT38_001613 [Cryptococcus sp. DSM 104549]